MLEKSRQTISEAIVLQICASSSKFSSILVDQLLILTDGLWTFLHTIGIIANFHKAAKLFQFLYKLYLIQGSKELVLPNKICIWIPVALFQGQNCLGCQHSSLTKH